MRKALPEYMFERVTHEPGLNIFIEENVIEYVWIDRRIRQMPIIPS
ncbi:11973_t:CDS:2 [Ambispora leptoticha]|uniref:11973_t:CDS:1 n=1 Tax=Ambispora leptoticha TaxID=144679 RepID=A0A9N9G7Y8_9GLOM|nr:11973_t:CDS:2 [Ambispora leptoticha]